MYNIPGQTITPMIMALKDLTGHQFEKIMTQIGWSRFLNNIPEHTDPTPIATREEVSALYKAIYNIGGEVVLRNFLRNLAHKMGAHFLTTTLFTNLNARVQEFPLSERLGITLALIAPGASRLFGDTCPLAEDSENYYVTVNDCLYCAPLKSKTSKPFCEFAEILYLKILRGITGLTDVTCFESSCKATGNQNCIFTFPKLEYAKV